MRAGNERPGPADTVYRRYTIAGPIVDTLMSTSAAVRPGPSLASRARDSLALMIRERELRAGQSVVEQQVAVRLGISRTPIREALHRLETEGLLKKTNSRSFEVRAVDLREYLHSLRVREVLESEAAAWAVERVDSGRVEAARESTRLLEAGTPYDKLAHWQTDDEVHALIIDSCGNDVMRKLLLSLRVTTQLFEIDRLSDRLGPDSREHERILDALADRDARAAREAVAAHIRSLYEFAVRTIG